MVHLLLFETKVFSDPLRAFGSPLLGSPKFFSVLKSISDKSPSRTGLSTLNVPLCTRLGRRVRKFRVQTPSGTSKVVLTGPFRPFRSSTTRRFSSQEVWNTSDCTLSFRTDPGPKPLDSMFGFRFDENSLTLLGRRLIDDWVSRVTEVY